MLWKSSSRSAGFYPSEASAPVVIHRTNQEVKPPARHGARKAKSLTGKDIFAVIAGFPKRAAASGSVPRGVLAAPQRANLIPDLLPPNWIMKRTYQASKSRRARTCTVSLSA